MSSLDKLLAVPCPHCGKPMRSWQRVGYSGACVKCVAWGSDQMKSAPLPDRPLNEPRELPLADPDGPRDFSGNPRRW